MRSEVACGNAIVSRGEMISEANFAQGNTVPIACDPAIPIAGLDAASAAPMPADSRAIERRMVASVGIVVNHDCLRTYQMTQGVRYKPLYRFRCYDRADTRDYDACSLSTRSIVCILSCRGRGQQPLPKDKKVSFDREKVASSAACARRV